MYYIKIKSSNTNKVITMPNLVYKHVVFLYSMFSERLFDGYNTANQRTLKADNPCKNDIEEKV